MTRPKLPITQEDYDALEHKNPDTLYWIDQDADPVPPWYGTTRYRLRIVLDHGLVLTTGPMPKQRADTYDGELMKYHHPSACYFPPLSFHADDGTTTHLQNARAARAWQTEVYPEEAA